MKEKRRKIIKRIWNEMPSELLVEIFRRLPMFYLFRLIYYVCKSWCSAVLDVLFPSPGVLDLSRIATYPKYQRKDYLRFLKILLDTRPNAQWHTLVLPPSMVRLKEHAILYIAQRSPCLKFLHLNILGVDCYDKAFPYWKNLKEYSCPTFMSVGCSGITSSLGNYCKNLQHLGLCGLMESETSSFIVKHLSELESLSLKKSSLTLDALLIFDGHKKLRILDLEHCLFVDADVLTRFSHGRWCVKRGLLRTWVQKRRNGMKRYMKRFQVVKDTYTVRKRCVMNVVGHINKKP